MHIILPTRPTQGPSRDRLLHRVAAPADRCFRSRSSEAADSVVAGDVVDDAHQAADFAVSVEDAGLLLAGLAKAEKFHRQ